MLIHRKIGNSETKVDENLPGIIDGRLWWQQSSAYWELPFYADYGLYPPKDRRDHIAAREQLWAIREGLTDY